MEPLPSHMDVEDLKRQAGQTACAFIESGMKLGLGTGSTVKYVLQEIARRIQDENLVVVGVPTSIETERISNKLGIPLCSLDEIDELDLVIDGADEFDPDFNLIKGGGAALVREKIIAQSGKKLIVVADERKQVQTLGTFPLPIEINQFSHLTTIRQLERLLQCEARLRMQGDTPLITDNGNFIADAFTGPSIDDPISLEQDILHLAGVVQVGIFTNMCHVVVLAKDSGVEVLMNSVA